MGCDTQMLRTHTRVAPNPQSDVMELTATGLSFVSLDRYRRRVYNPTLQRWIEYNTKTQEWRYEGAHVSGRGRMKLCKHINWGRI